MVNAGKNINYQGEYQIKDFEINYLKGICI